MTITRMLALLVGGLLALLAVVVVRSETARLNYRLSKLDARELGLRLQIREHELEAGRLKSPGAVRARLAGLHGTETERGIERVGAAGGAAGVRVRGPGRAKPAAAETREEASRRGRVEPRRGDGPVRGAPSP